MLASNNLDLRKSVVMEYWKERDPIHQGRLARMLMWMESVEDWSLDEHPDIVMEINRLTYVMQQADSIPVGDTAEEWLTMLAYLSSSRALRIVEWIDYSRRNENGALPLVQTARAMRHHEHAQLLTDRLQALRMLDLLGKIFSPRRLDTVTLLLRRAQQG